VLAGIAALLLLPPLLGADDDDSGNSTNAAPEQSPANPTGAGATPVTTPFPYVGDDVALLTFRGNRARTFYGIGGVPSNPHVAWRSSVGPSCGSETEPCTSGWTAQPVVFDWRGSTVVVIGGADGAVHFIDGADGSPVMQPFSVGAPVSGTATVDPEGFPIVYVGSDDGILHALAFDGTSVEEVWRFDRASGSGPWVSSPLVVAGLLVTTTPDGHLVVVRLDRKAGPEGEATLDVEIILDEQIGGGNAPGPGSVALVGRTAYLSSGDGRVQGWDLGPVAERTGPPLRTFVLETGGPSEATISIDSDRNLYGASGNTVSPPTVGPFWSLAPEGESEQLIRWTVNPGGSDASTVAASPVVAEGVIVVATPSGGIVGLHPSSGSRRWTIDLAGPIRSSPIFVDGVLIQGDCAGQLHAFTVNGSRQPVPSWRADVGGCVTSTPAVWRGSVYVRSSDGDLVALRDRAAASAGPRPTPGAGGDGDGGSALIWLLPLILAGALAGAAVWFFARRPREHEERSSGSRDERRRSGSDDDVWG
jgi:outer membrane protein assembly factor BamB